MIGEDQNKVEIAFANVGSLDDLVALSDKLKFDEVKLNQIYNHLNNAEIDDATKSADLSHYRSLTDKLFTSPKKLNAVFENVDKLEVLDDNKSRIGMLRASLKKRAIKLPLIIWISRKICFPL